MRTSRASWLVTLAVIALALVAHLRVFVQHPADNSPDSISYLEPAGHILRDGTFSSRHLIAYAAPPGVVAHGGPEPYTVRTPVYPAIIALVFALGGTMRILVLLQHLFVVVIAGSMHRFLMRFTSTAGAATAALLFALHPATLDASNIVLSETTMAVLVAVASVALWSAQAKKSWKWAALSGVLWGLAIVTRPIAVYLPIVIVAMLLIRRLRLSMVAAFAIAAAVLPGMWIARNAAVSGVPTISSIAGENLLLYRAVGALVVAGKNPADAVLALQKQFGYYREALHLRRKLLEEAWRDAAADGKDPQTTNHAQLSRYYAALGMRKLAEHPLAYAEIATSAAIALFVDDLSSIAAGKGMHIDTARVALVPVSLAILTCAVVGLWKLRRVDRDAALTLAVILGYFVVLSSGPEVEVRFIVPYLPLYAAAAGVGAPVAWQRIRESIESWRHRSLTTTAHDEIA